MTFAPEFEAEPYAFHLAYSSEDYAVTPCWASEAPPGLMSGLSVSAGTLVVELGRESQIVCCWGYFPAASWAKGQHSLPKGKPGRVTVQTEEQLVPGVSRSVEGSNEWSAVESCGTKWIYFGGQPTDEDVLSVQVAEGLICCLKGTHLVGLWLFVDR